MKGYKLTNAKDQTHGATQWGPGVTHKALGDGGKFCTPDLIHFYSSPLLAVLLDPMHGQFGEGAHLWEVKTGRITFSDYGLKEGAKILTTVRRVPLPKATTEQRARFAILCAKQVCKNKAWDTWADGWLDGTDRSRAAAARAADAVDVAATYAARAADAAPYAAAYAARYADRAAAAADVAATYAADAAAYAARDADADADAARYAADAAAYATRAAGMALGLEAIAEEAMK